MEGREYTEDSLFSGRLTCLQHRQGYRFSADAVLLAHFVTPSRNAHVLDLCAGCGVVSLILAFRWPTVRLSALEIQPQLAELIRRNAAANSFARRISVLEGDCRSIGRLLAPEACDLVVCNPPYGRLAAGRINPEDEQALARHEILAGLGEVVSAAAFSLKNRGRAAFVYPARRAASLIASLKNNKLEPKRLQVVHSYPGDVGRLVLVEAVKNGGEELVIEAPLYVYQEKDGVYTPEMAACYAV